MRAGTGSGGLAAAVLSLLCVPCCCWPAVFCQTASRVQFAIGDYALEAVPMRAHGGQEKSEAPFTVKEASQDLQL
ncbi:hypothetical protein JCM4814A_80930 [Streptomyces phaeofaciens JCM 4814]|uniref:Uncharacterized protein n=1 Tax=Streptomyces phaeofaciens TaxID=68254 RepID=A0A918HQP7_9ACTN|nr:hypothetical protein GCM10010226_86550 [Streptomyces phaeofaciens]